MENFTQIFFLLAKERYGSSWCLWCVNTQMLRRLLYESKNAENKSICSKLIDGRQFSMSEFLFRIRKAVVPFRKYTDEDESFFLLVFFSFYYQLGNTELCRFKHTFEHWMRHIGMCACMYVHTISFIHRNTKGNISVRLAVSHFTARSAEISHWSL